MHVPHWNNITFIQIVVIILDAYYILYSLRNNVGNCLQRLLLQQLIRVRFLLLKSRLSEC